MKKILFIFAAVLLGSIGLHAGSQITYKATERLSGYNGSLESGSTTFGPKIYTHQFSDGDGLIYCYGEITTIGNNAFYSCHGLTSITIPNSVTTIGQEAFWDCNGMTAITMSDSITSIEGSAFAHCTSLDSIILPNSVTSIGRLAFYKCTGLKKVYCYALVPPSLGADVFTNVPQDELSVYVLDVKAYSDQRAWGLQLPASCFKRFLIEIDGIKYEILEGNKARVIGKDGGYTGNIIIPEQITFGGKNFTVTEIGQDAFKNCSGLTSITIPNSVPMIGDSAFVHCSKLGSLKIGNSVTTIGDGAFFGCTGLTSIVVADGNPKYDSRDNCNAIIEKATNTLILGCKNTKVPNNITTIGDYAFYGCYDLKDITIPNSVTTIGANAFAGCTKLESLTIGNSVTTIGDGAFSHCALGAVTLPVSVMQIGKRAFEYCEQLKSVKLPSNLTLIDEGTFQHTGLESVVIPVSVKRIENYAFDACPLKYVECIPETPPTLGSTNTFTKNDTAIVYVPTPEATVAYRSSDWKNYFTKIYSYITYRQTSSNTVEVIDALPIDKKVEIPAMFSSLGTFYKVTGIGDNAFKDKDSLVSISLPPTIQYIGNSSFNGCKNLKDINIEYIEDLQTIGDKAFYNTALDSIVIPERVQSLGKAAFAYSILHYVSLPTGLKNIPDDCFRGCPFGTEIIVPEGVETIGTNGFAYSANYEKVTLITLPSTITEIKNYAFANRSKLEEVICLAQNPPTLGGSVFTNQKTAIVYVPDRDAMQTYQNSSWKNYKFTFADLMAEANKAYLYEVAGNNIEAQDTARHYCLLIDNAQSTAEVQNYTTIALERIDKLTLTDYKNALADSLDRYAQGNAEAQRIADQYTPRIRDAYSRPAAEQLFTEAYMKITDIYELIKLKQNYKEQLIKLADGDQDLLKVATNYGALIDHAETKEEARELYERATMRMNINKQINYDWKGGSVKVNNHTCSTTKGYK